MSTRLVLPELLDVLPPQDASALRSRRDLRRVNAWMHHPQIMARVLQENLPANRPCAETVSPSPAGAGEGRGEGARASRAPCLEEPGNSQQIVELGAGDGHFLLSVAKRLHGRWPGTKAILVDRLNVPDPQICGQFRGVGWQARVEIAEALEWLRRTQPGTPQTIISNLFFHQFETEQLAEMLRLAAASSHLVVALEPRRSWLSGICGRLLWAIGCGPVTRHDAHISIRAGFAGAELSALWPDKQNWRLTEQAAGLFSHLFIAQRNE